MAFTEQVLKNHINHSIQTLTNSNLYNNTNTLKVNISEISSPNIDLSINNKVKHLIVSGDQDFKGQTAIFQDIAEKFLKDNPGLITVIFENSAKGIFLAEGKYMPGLGAKYSLDLNLTNLNVVMKVGNTPMQTLKLNDFNFIHNTLAKLETFHAAIENIAVSSVEPSIEAVKFKPSHDITNKTANTTVKVNTTDIANKIEAKAADSYHAVKAFAHNAEAKAAHTIANLAGKVQVKANDVANNADKLKANDVANNADKLKANDVANNTDKLKANDVANNTDKLKANDVANNTDKLKANDATTTSLKAHTLVKVVSNEVLDELILCRSKQQEAEKNLQLAEKEQEKASKDLSLAQAAKIRLEENLNNINKELSKANNEQKDAQSRLEKADNIISQSSKELQETIERIGELQENIVLSARSMTFDETMKPVLDAKIDAGTKAAKELLDKSADSTKEAVHQMIEEYELKPVLIADNQEETTKLAGEVVEDIRVITPDWLYN